MSPRAMAVIGAGYGDEGKGLMTDALVAALGGAATVVRFNGGAQAGHTVTAAREGKPPLRHVFHHVGSGALAGAPTFLSRFFVVNPILLAQELAELEAEGVRLKIYVDPRAPVTTPYDMMLNQFAEQARGGARHGSCGLGFGETLERSLRPEFALSAAQLADARALRRLLGRIRSEWAPIRAAALMRAAGAAPVSPGDWRLVESEAIFEQWLEDAAAFLDAVEICDPAILRRTESLVFEGAQGLGLDQDRGSFPFVTRSNTGLKNVLTLAAEAGASRLDAVYATRAYATRHGTGPLAHELPGPAFDGIEDATNVPNPWQGALRFGLLDLSILARSIAADLSDAAGAPFPVAHSLAVTCLDQTGRRPSYIAGGRERRASPQALARAAADAAGARGLITAWGPGRETVDGLGGGPGAAVA